MAEEGYKIQISVKVDDAMVNVRADDAEELALILSNLEESDSDVLQTLASEIGEVFGGGGKKKSKSKSKKKSRDDDDDDDDDDDEDEDDDSDDDEPTEAQLKFAKRLKIKGASKMTKQELSKAIDKKTKKKK